VGGAWQRTSAFFFFFFFFFSFISQSLKFHSPNTHPLHHPQVGLSVGIAGYGAAIARGLLANLPFGAISLAGARTVDEARAAREAGADALFIRRELVDAFAGREGELVRALRCATDGDD
jgi:hypothetical protein